MGSDVTHNVSTGYVSIDVSWRETGIDCGETVSSFSSLRLGTDFFDEETLKDPVDI